MRRYYLHTRYKGIFYVELVDPATGRKLVACGTGTKTGMKPCWLLQNGLRRESLRAGYESLGLWKRRRGLKTSSGPSEKQTLIQMMLCGSLPP
jgi:hypothetical protein